MQHLLQKDNLSKRERERFESNKCKCQRGRGREYVFSTCLFFCKTDSQRDTLATPGAGALANSSTGHWWGNVPPFPRGSAWKRTQKWNKLHSSDYLSQALHWGNGFSRTKKEKHCQSSFDILKDNNPLLFPHSSTTCFALILSLGTDVEHMTCTDVILYVWESSLLMPAQVSRSRKKASHVYTVNTIPPNSA